MSALLEFHLIREHLIVLVLDLGPGKCVKNHILFVPLTKKLVSTSSVLQAEGVLCGMRNFKKVYFA